LSDNLVYQPAKTAPPQRQAGSGNVTSLPAGIDATASPAPNGIPFAPIGAWLTPEPDHGTATADDVMQVRWRSDLILRRPEVLSLLIAAVAIREAILASPLTREERRTAFALAWRGLKAAVNTLFPTHVKVKLPDWIGHARAMEFTRSALRGEGLYAKPRPPKRQRRSRVSRMVKES
jgi:hypothetical protein